MSPHPSTLPFVCPHSSHSLWYRPRLRHRHTLRGWNKLIMTRRCSVGVEWFSFNLNIQEFSINSKIHPKLLKKEFFLGGEKELFGYNKQVFFIFQMIVS
jgi:hypothetical protein